MPQKSDDAWKGIARWLQKEFKLLRDPEYGPDILQDIFTTYLAQGGNWSQPNAFFAYRVARDRVGKFLRRHRREADRTRPLWDDILAKEESGGAIEARLDDCIAALPEREREIIERYLASREKPTLESIGKAMKLSTATVHRDLGRAISRLADCTGI